ncbi:hypothetical protein [Insulibacter thermoxylanivorax]|nr:hypothetical protein [Insulibacter thermoxylanivorax]
MGIEVEMMWQRWNAKERFWCVVFLLATLSLITAANTWLDMETERRRAERVERIAEELRTAIQEIQAIQRTGAESTGAWDIGSEVTGAQTLDSGNPGTEVTGTQTAVAEGQTAETGSAKTKAEEMPVHPALMRKRESYEELLRLEVVYIPYLLRQLEREEEQMGRILAYGITEIGKLNIPPDAWSNTAEWKELWNASVARAETAVPSILASEDLTEAQQAAQLIALGAPAVPLLIEEMKSGEGSQACMIALTILLEHDLLEQGVSRAADADHAEPFDAAKWRWWAERYYQEYAGLAVYFH